MLQTLGCTALMTLLLAGQEPAVVPVGLDAYRMWDRWPAQRIGVRAYMRSTYDRRGGNEAADASHFLYQLADDNNVTLDVEGPGVLYFVRTNHWHGSPWRYVVDGTEHIVRETSTHDPEHPAENSTFEPAELFPPPLVWTWSTTRGADLMWVPIPFERSFRLGYSRTHYGTGYYIYHQFVGGTKLSQPIRAWDGRTPPGQDVLDLLNRAGSDLLAVGEPAPSVREHRAGGMLSAGETKQLVQLTDGPAAIRGLEITVPREQALALGKARLRITWDNRSEPSVDAPVALFFGAAVLYNRDNREYLVRGFPLWIRYVDDKVHLACFFPMPYFRSARVELVETTGTRIDGLECRVRAEPLSEPPAHVAYFHATYQDIPQPRRGHDLVVLDTTRTEGGGDWSGQFVGMSWIFSHDAVLTTLEGDPRFFFDDSRSPQCYGTGTEEWGGGGDYWGGRNMTLPLAGHPCGAPNAKEARCPEDKIQSAYRFLLADLMPFGRNARIQLEHGGTNESTEHYETVAYWYGTPAASLILTDTLDVGDEVSESAHAYHSPDASAPEQITSRYEWGVDTLDGQEIYPAHTQAGRHTATFSEFTLKLRPDNLGVLLRRTLDYSYPNQRAEVSVADASQSSEPREADWQPAGVWYLAGSNTCIFSNPKGELGATEHHIQTSNRRFRDDEFLVPRGLTQGRSAIRVRVQFTPVRRPIAPGEPLPDLAWSELGYNAYCYVLPEIGR